jgi:ribosomal-protein-alanine N-acetyltransferase
LIDNALMSAVLKPEVRLEPLTPALLDDVLRVEQSAYSHPWTRGNFADSFKAGYEVVALLGGDTLLGYFVAMEGVDEVHLLNITVAPEFQGQGWAVLMLDALAVWSRGRGAQWLWLEVRASNQRALSLYRRRGFVEVAVRRDYYPASTLRREDAIVMRLDVRGEAG